MSKLFLYYGFMLFIIPDLLATKPREKDSAVAIRRLSLREIQVIFSRVLHISIQ